MATRTISALGGNWNQATAWAEGFVPTSADDVAANGLSGNLTITAAAACRSIDLTGYTGTLTHNSSVTLSIGDGTAGAGGVALKLVAGMTYTKGSLTSSALAFVSSAASVQTITWAGKTPGNVSFTGAGGSWQVQDAWSATSTQVALTAGTLDTNGQTCTWTAFLSTGSTARTLTLGATTLTLSLSSGLMWNASGSNFTMNAGTSTVNVTGAGSVTFSPIAGTAFYNLSRTGAPFKTGGWSHNTDFTVSNNLTITADSSVNALLVASGTPGTARTITVNGAVSISGRVDFSDITGAGTASWDLSGSTSGDCGGNSGITFTAAATRYAVAAGNWSSTAVWSASSGGAGGASVPLPQDDVVLNGAAAAGTYTADMPRLGKSIDCSGFTRTLALTLGTGMTLYGSLALASGMTLTFTSGVTFGGRSAFSLTTAGKSWSQPLALTAPGGTLALQDDLGGTGTITVNAGTLDANGFDVDVSTVAAAGLLAGLDLGDGTWTLSGVGTVWSVGTTVTLTAGQSTIVTSSASGTARTFAGGGKTYHRLEYTAVTTATLSITGNNTFAVLQVSGGAKTVSFANNSTTTITSDFDVDGAAGSLVVINRASSGVFTLTKASGVVNPTHLDIRNSTATGGAQWVASNSTDGGGNTGWIFGAAAQAASASASPGAAAEAVAPTAGSAVSAAAGQDATADTPGGGGTSAPAGLASSSSSAQAASAAAAPAASLAQSSSPAHAPSAALGATASLASASASALDASATTAVSAQAGAAAASPSAASPSASVAPRAPASPSGSAAAGPSTAVGAGAGSASGAGSPGDPGGAGGPSPPSAQADASAPAASPSLAGGAQPASSSAAPAHPSAAVAPTSQTASTAGAALDAAASTAAQANALAGLASASASALSATAAVAPLAGEAASSGSAQAPSLSITALAQPAPSTSSVPPASSSVGPAPAPGSSAATGLGGAAGVGPSPGTASAAGAAPAGSPSVSPQASPASALASALDAATTAAASVPGSVSVSATFPSVAVSVSYAGVVVSAEPSGGSVEVSAEAV